MRAPGTNYPYVTQTTETLASTGTQNVALFSITGTVKILELWGVVLTAIGVNHTAAAWRINDQTAQVYLTAVTGTALSGKAAGSVIYKKGVVATALTLIDNAAGAVLEPTALETPVETPVIVTKKTGAATNIEYHFATTDNPTSGVIQHFVRWIPLSADGNIVAI